MAARLLCSRSNASRPCSERCQTIPFPIRRHVAPVCQSPKCYPRHLDGPRPTLIPSTRPSQGRDDEVFAALACDKSQSRGRVRYPFVLQSYIIFRFRSWEGNWKIGWMGGCGCALVCENTGGYSRAGLVSPSVSYILPVPFLVCVCSSTESYQSNFSRTLLAQLPGWAWGDMSAQRLATGSTAPCWGVRVQNSSSFLRLG